MFQKSQSVSEDDDESLRDGDDVSSFVSVGFDRVDEGDHEIVSEVA